MGDYTLPSELDVRAKAIMAKLAVLSDAPTQTIDLAAPAHRASARMEPGKTWLDHESTRTPAFDSKAPPGVREWRKTHFDPESDPLIDWFIWKLSRCRNLWEAEAAVLEAEMRHANRINATSPRPHGLAGNPETTRSRDNRIARDYRGLSPEQVAAVETVRSGYCTPENVRRTRLVKERDPETGNDLPPETFMRGDARKRRARELDRADVPVREIARRFRVHHSTVLGWLGRRNAA